MRDDSPLNALNKTGSLGSQLSLTLTDQTKSDGVVVDKQAVFRISIPSQNTQKSIRANLDDTVWTVKAQIIESMAKGVVDVLNFGLFYSAGEGKEGKFLEESRHISDYALVDKFKMKHKLGVQPGTKAYEKDNNKKTQKKIMEWVRDSNVDEMNAKILKTTDVNFSYDDGTTLNDNRSMIMALIEQGAILDFRTRHGQFTGSFATVTQGSPNVLGSTYFAPMHVAASENKMTAFQTLLHFGASPLIRDSAGLTPWSHAASNGHTDIVKLILAWIVGQPSTKSQQLNTEVELLDMQQRTALHYACANGHANVVKVLLEYGASPNVLNSTLNTPLHVTCTSPKSGEGHKEVARLLLNYGADKEKRTRAGQNPSQVALMSGNMELSDFIKKFVVEDSAKLGPMTFEQLQERDKPIWIQIRKNIGAGVILSGAPLFTIARAIVPQAVTTSDSASSLSPSMETSSPVGTINSIPSSMTGGSIRAPRRAPPPSIPADFRAQNDVLNLSANSMPGVSSLNSSAGLPPAVPASRTMRQPPPPPAAAVSSPVSAQNSFNAVPAQFAPQNSFNGMPQMNGMMTSQQQQQMMTMMMSMMMQQQSGGKMMPPLPQPLPQTQEEVMAQLSKLEEEKKRLEVEIERLRQHMASFR